MDYPKNLKYTKEHEWVKIEGHTATIGVTDHAQDAMGDVVYVELPPEGGTVTKGDPFGVVESVKAVSDLYSPLTGTISDANDALFDSPEVVNDDRYGDAWFIKIDMEDTNELTDLLTPEEYVQYLEEEK